jgi:hypothetical protein
MSSLYNSIIDYLREKEYNDQGSLTKMHDKATFIDNYANGEFEIEEDCYYDDGSCEVVFTKSTDKSRRRQNVRSLEQFKNFVYDCCSSCY